MAPTRLAVCATACLISAPVLAEPGDFPDEIVAISCDEPHLPQDLSEVCDGLAESLADVMSRRDGSGPVAERLRAPLPSLARRPYTSNLTAGGLVDERDKLNPFEQPADRALGVQVNATQMPLSFRTEVVQPGDPEGLERLNWEVRTTPGATADQSGVFGAAAAGGSYDEHGGESRHINASAGWRRVVKPADGVRVVSEIAPNVNSDGETITSFAVVPRLATSAQFNEIGDTNLIGTLSADLGYTLPNEGEPSAHGGFRLTIRPK
jgi:hypothetical protein